MITNFRILNLKTLGRSEWLFLSCFYHIFVRLLNSLVLVPVFANKLIFYFVFLGQLLYLYSDLIKYFVHRNTRKNPIYVDTFEHLKPMTYYFSNWSNLLVLLFQWNSCLFKCYFRFWYLFLLVLWLSQIVRI